MDKYKTNKIGHRILWKMQLFKLFKEIVLMKIFNTNFFGLKKIKGINHYDKRGYFREISKNNFFKKKNFIFLDIFS